MVADFIAWLYADLPPAGQQEKIKPLGLRLIEMIREGHFGLLRWLDRWVAPVEAPAEGQLAQLASR